jgi:hypothetical protein
VSPWLGTRDATTSGPRITGGLDGVRDPVIAGAAAEVAVEGVENPLAVRGQAVVEQVDGASDDARRAESALDGALLDESLRALPLPSDAPSVGSAPSTGSGRNRQARPAGRRARIRAAAAEASGAQSSRVVMP